MDGAGPGGFQQIASPLFLLFILPGHQRHLTKFDFSKESRFRLNISSFTRKKGKIVEFLEMVGLSKEIQSSRCNDMDLNIWDWTGRLT